jgi:uncharacterized protein (DUF1810 family)
MKNSNSVEPKHCDVHNLQRFIDAQDSIYEMVCSELRTGHKRGHWMWFIFPQIIGLGSSATAQKYGIRSRAEARAYLNNAILGPRLRHCAKVLMSIEGRSAEGIFGPVDAMKLRSCMTLFDSVTANDRTFSDVLRKYFGDERDQLTVNWISQ